MAEQSEMKSGGSQPLHETAEGSSSSIAKGEEDAVCPLFMEGLPSNFATNPGLAAIASLLNESDNEDYDTKKRKGDKKEDDSSTNNAISKVLELKPGGGKVQRTRLKGRSSRSSPYNKDKDGNNNKKKTKQDKKGASLGEAQLFLNMWKL